MVEVIKFAEIKISAEGKSLEEFDAMLANKCRRYLLRSLKFEIMPSRFKMDDFRALFSRLQKWTINEEDLAKAPSFKLTMTTPWRNCEAEIESPPMTTEFERVHKLPTAACVDKFECWVLEVHPGLMAAILQALPRIRCLEWGTRKVPSRSDELGNDRLSLAVNRIMKLPNIKVLNLESLFSLSPTVFDPSEGGGFPHSLESVTLQVSKTTPTGEWHFIGDRSSAVVDEAEDSPSPLAGPRARHGPKET
ncbi:hypothetical protein F4819DRAFT_452974 [Hypoxylon fuscum]|nr:hypothetical protein F4819DRAFT_452974 [Hypoxylon fuscum]